jgi:hypothetical protein
MTHLAALAAGTILGALAMYARHLTWAEAHDWRRIRLAHARLKVLYQTADHERRLRIRVENSSAELRAAVGDLLDRLAARDHENALLRRAAAAADRGHRPQHARRRRNAMPIYGTRRAA